MITRQFTAWFVVLCIVVIVGYASLACTTGPYEVTITATIRAWRDRHPKLALLTMFVLGGLVYHLFMANYE